MIKKRVRDILAKMSRRNAGINILTGMYYDKEFNIYFNKFIDIVYKLREMQNSKTGSWLNKNAPFFAEIETNIEITSLLAQFGLTPKYKLSFLEKYRNWDKLKNKFEKWKIETKDGMNRANMNKGATKLMRFYKLVPGMFSKKWLENYLRFFLDWQDPSTGCWGVCLKKENKLIKTSDLSLTFHIIKRFYKKNGEKRYNLEIPNIQKIIETIWDLENKEYPFGWKEKNKWNGHHIMDVIVMMKICYKYLDKKEKNKIIVFEKKVRKWSEIEIKKILEEKNKEKMIENLCWFAQMPTKFNDLRRINSEIFFHILYDPAILRQLI
ncbi:hypothetical protein HYW76_00990 [Candidatus Pacearchaeota archaeon]|nr:hypothetical protein [Candidatus Pacearchaeota archaeon]